MRVLTLNEMSAVSGAGEDDIEVIVVRGIRPSVGIHMHWPGGFLGMDMASEVAQTIGDHFGGGGLEEIDYTQFSENLGENTLAALDALLQEMLDSGLEYAQIGESVFEIKPLQTAIKGLSALNIGLQLVSYAQSGDNEGFVNALSGAIAGAAAGSLAGGLGAIPGALVGLVVGGLVAESGAASAFVNFTAAQLAQTEFANIAANPYAYGDVGSNHEFYNGFWHDFHNRPNVFVEGTYNQP